jgi:hypothetical protein
VQDGILPDLVIAGFVAGSRVASRLGTTLYFRLLMDFRVVSQLNTKMQRFEPPGHQDRQEEKGRLREMKPRKSGIDFSFSLASLLANLASWRFNSSMDLIDSSHHPGIHNEPYSIAVTLR